MVVQSLTRPYLISTPTALLLIFFFLLVPFYIFIPQLMPRRTLHVPEITLDRFFPLQPAWALIYGSLYLFMILLPVFVVRQEEHLRRTILAYLFIWIIAYICFLFYPTVAPRPINVTGEGFAVWGLRFLYSADPPYNCFPSLHVAHSLVSALTCYRVHRGVGIVGIVCALMIGVSTLFTKQHYALDVVAGILLAFVAYAIFLRTSPGTISDHDRRVAPLLAISVIGFVSVIAVGFWIAYQVS
jgi:membrane-associated phospholipid phosphatase